MRSSRRYCERLAVHSPAYQLPPEYEAEFRSSYPKLEFHLLGGLSHYLMMEQPFRINQLLYDFAQRLSF